ncbi:uncharacterized protein LOC128955663 [Oppia nitens]|uniref:uncharacterized protein LOC128955663 n=1 Tax=Oppia nitens TaxID=1686743 RepID=UPI0023DC6BB4|nr:uncharacterized protein LOC128955663 [Oppia nitens]
MDSNGQQSESLKDNKSMENEKLVYNQLMRGKTPEDIKEQCLQLCQDYIAGDWIRQTVETIEVKRITGGLTNQLYKCSIITPEANTTVTNIVAIRIYGIKWTENNVYEDNARLSDIIVSVMVSEKKLGPKLLGIFNGGEISYFYNHRYFKLEEQNDVKLVEELFQKIARIHAMNVPIKRKHWMINEMEDNYKKVKNQSSITQLIDELNCETLKTVDISNEINWIKHKVIESGSPEVFSHNDLCCANIMVLEDNEYNNSEDQLLICDYEYAPYSYRGQDLGSTILEWGRDGTVIDTDHDFIDDNIIKQLLLYYIDENIKIFVMKNSEDISSINELFVGNTELYRGETPIDINDQCLQLCKDYLSGEWIQQTVDTIAVRRITGGLMNQLYYCGINDQNITSKVPQEVAILFYGEKITKAKDNNYERLNDVIIDLMVSENQIGPKVCALFEHGQIQHYYQHRQFKPEEQNNPKLVDEVFRKLARIHAMDVPINRTFNWLTTELNDIYKLAFEGSIDIKAMSEKYNCEALMTADMKNEVQFINELIVKANSPIVFIHCDYRSSNLLITESVDKSDGPLVVCDFEYASYGYRAYDFMPLLQEWGRNQLNLNVDGIPLEESISRPLIEIYVDECHRIYGEEYSANAINTVDHILHEIKIFYVIYQFFMTLICLKMDLNNNAILKNLPLVFKF